VTGYGRAAVEVRLPLGTTLLRAGVGARAGYLAQTVTPRATAGVAAREQTNGAFVLAPELQVAVRRELGDLLFAELSGTGSLVGFREEGSTRLVPTVQAGAGMGARF
jgi:hypothetical protein